MDQPRIIISGLSGGSGKTLVSLGLCRMFTRRGLAVQGFKKGPDYIDSAWLSLAAGKPAACLDPFFLDDAALLSHFCSVCAKSQAEIAVIEGNRGLFDGRDVQGSCSTAHVASTLSSPVLITLNCAKMTRTAAAIIAGLQNFEPGLKLAVILNNTANERHAAMLRACIKQYTDVPVIGVLPRMECNPIPERHLGLSMGISEQKERSAVLDALADLLEAHCDVPSLLSLAQNASSLPTPQFAQKHAARGNGRSPRIGYVLDDAIWFYYQENLDALTAEGAQLERLSILDPRPWPATLDGLYLGGGYPELFAKEISLSPHLAEIRAMSLAFRPIYAECGGMMLLSRFLKTQNGSYPMAGILPLSIEFCKTPQGLGYVEACAQAPNPFHPVGTQWRGHEFHYSRGIWTNDLPECCLEIKMGKGLLQKDGKRYDGLLKRHTFACWTHLFAPAVPHWAPCFVRAAIKKSG